MASLEFAAGLVCWLLVDKRKAMSLSMRMLSGKFTRHR